MYFFFPINFFIKSDRKALVVDLTQTILFNHGIQNSLKFILSALIIANTKVYLFDIFIYPPLFEYILL